ncbi:aldo/keto reductase [Bacillus sp. MM09(2025)]|uniref:aldo/keto reductase n=1 Tax=Bacillus sp. MM09(2025) TaxID=3422493 RepID=UPI003D2C4646
MNYVTLNNGLKMPQLGYGVFQVGNEETAHAVSQAIKLGYTSIDTAAIYKNEKGVKDAIRNMNRDELFITTKVWNSDHGFEKTLAAFESSLERLGLEYIDLYLIHWPTPEFGEYVETYKALEKLYKDGRVKAIGVCNFEIEHLKHLLAETEIKPVLNQIECHPYLVQKELKDFCQDHDIFIEAWSPLERGGNVLNDKTIVSISEKYGKTPAQVILRWHLQNNTIVIPKTVTPSRMEENMQIFDFELLENDMEAINNLDCGRRTGPHPNEMNVR